MFDWLTKSKPTDLTQSTTTTMGKDQQDLFNRIFPSLQGAASQTPQVFGGSTVAGLTPDQIAAQNKAREAAGGSVQNLATQGAATQGQLLDPNFMLNTNTPQLTAARDSVTNDTTQNFLQHILPSLRGGATIAGGMYSGGQSKAGIAEGQATGDTSRALATTLANMNMDAWKAGMSGLQSAEQNNPNVMSAQLMPSAIQGAVGTQTQTQNQAELNDQVQRYYLGQQLPFMHAQEILSAIQGMPGATTTSHVQGQTQQPSWLQQLLGLGVAGAGMAGKAMAA